MVNNRIKTFLTLCHLMNYRRTAEELHMTQPAVTQHIHYLEQEYGCRLFVYDRKSLRMTREAEILRRYAENVLYHENRLRTQLHQHGGWKLSIGATKTIGEYVIAGQISRYLADGGNRLSVEVDNTEHLLRLLSDGALDFALIEGFFDRSKYACRLYRKEAFVGICAAGHPFAGRTISLDELLREHIILREAGSGTRNIFEQLLSQHNHTPADFDRVTVIGNFGLMTRLIERLQGVTFAYSALLENNEHLSAFQVEGWNTVREFNYVYLDNPFSIQAVEYFDSFRN